MRAGDERAGVQPTGCERIPSDGHGRSAQFIPHRFEFANKLAKEHKLLLAFDALLLSEALGREVNLGKIVHGDATRLQPQDCEALELVANNWLTCITRRPLTASRRREKWSLHPT